MSVDHALSFIPAGWRLYTLDASIDGRFHVNLSGPKHPVESGSGVVEIDQHVSAVRGTLDDAVMSAAEKAAQMHRGWLIEENWLGEYEATHPDFDPTPLYLGDGPSDSRSVTGKTRADVIAEIDEWIAENLSPEGNPHG